MECLEKPDLPGTVNAENKGRGVQEPGALAEKAGKHSGAGCGRSWWTQGSSGFQGNTSLVLLLFLLLQDPWSHSRSVGF